MESGVNNDIVTHERHDSSSSQLVVTYSVCVCVYMLVQLSLWGLIGDPDHLSEDILRRWRDALKGQFEGSWPRIHNRRGYKNEEEYVY